MRLIWLSAIVFSLSGCALPVAVSVASLAADVGSYVASGKTVTDHGLSVVMDKDCALLRVVEGQICEEEGNYEVALATLTPLPEEEGMELDLASGAEPGSWTSPDAPSADRWLQVAERIPGDALFGDHYLAADMMSVGL
jgi:hypothetical protein